MIITWFKQHWHWENSNLSIEWMQPLQPEIRRSLSNRWINSFTIKLLTKSTQLKKRANFIQFAWTYLRKQHITLARSTLVVDGHASSPLHFTLYPSPHQRCWMLSWNIRTTFGTIAYYDQRCCLLLSVFLSPKYTFHSLELSFQVFTEI